MDPIVAMALDKLALAVFAVVVVLLIGALAPKVRQWRRRYWVTSEGLDPNVMERLRENSDRLRARAGRPA